MMSIINYYRDWRCYRRERAEISRLDTRLRHDIGLTDGELAVRFRSFGAWRRAQGVCGTRESASADTACDRVPRDRFCLT